MFQRANNIHIAGGTFAAPVQGDVVIYGHPSTGRQTGNGLQLLFNSISPGAFHNSAERYDAPKCHPQTRLAILEKIMNWIKDITNPQSPRFIWMYGPAGSGKSAIAQTIAEICEREGITIASFFFSRTVSERNNERSLISTLVYQIYLAIPEIRDPITAAVEHDPSIFSRSLDCQTRALMVEPLSVAPPQLIPKLILIDGLDECVDSKAQKCILQALAAATAQLNNSVRFLVTSRPEQVIRTSFNAPTFGNMMIGVPLDETYKPDADIKTFLNSRFSEIRRDHPSRAFLPKLWPPEGAVDILVERTSGQFIYASTVMKFIESHHHRPSNRLNIILGVSKSGSDSDAPFAELDAVYHHVLSNISPYNRAKVIEVLTFLILTSTVPKWAFARHLGGIRFLNHQPRTIERVLRYEEGDLYIYLLDMQSIVHVPEQSSIEELRFHHASFPDFLLDHSRSREYYIDIGKAHAHLTICWWKYWDRRTQYLDRRQNIFIMQTLLHHWTRSTLTSTFLKGLCALDLSEILDDIHGTDLRSLVEWNSLYLWIRKQEFPNVMINPLRRHISAFKTWVHARLERYPASLRMLLYAALNIVEHHDDLPNISKILIEMVLEPSESERKKFQRLDEELLYFKMPRPLATLFRSHQQCCDSHESSVGDLRMGVDGRAYADLSIKLAQFLISTHQGPTRYVQSEEPNRFERESAAWNTLTAILPRAAYRSALDSLLRHPVFAEPIDRTHPEFQMERYEKMMVASLKYFKNRALPIFPTS